MTKHSHSSAAAMKTTTANTTRSSCQKGRIVEQDIECQAEDGSCAISTVKKEDSAEDLTIQEKEEDENNSFDEEESAGVSPTKGEGGEESSTTQPPPPRQRCRDHPRVTELYTTADWWSLWIGLATFAMAYIAVFSTSYEQGSDRVKYVIPEPLPWKTNPLDAWDLYNLYGTILLLFSFGAMYVVSLKFMGKLDVAEPTKVVYKYIIGFVTMATLATISSGVQIMVSAMPSFPSFLA
jgi:hypothetical protein